MRGNKAAAMLGCSAGTWQSSEASEEAELWNHMPLELPIGLSVRDQLANNGVQETIRVRRAGYPFRFIIREFTDRYWPLVGCKQHEPPDKLCRRILAQVCDVNNKRTWQMGKTKIFISSDAVLADLEAARVQILQKYAVKIQSMWHMYQVRSRYLRLRQALIRLQAAIRSYLQRKWYLRYLAARTIQKYGRRQICRARFIKYRFAQTIQKNVRRLLAIRAKARALAAILVLQKNCRMVRERRQYRKFVLHVKRVQARVRGKRGLEAYQRVYCLVVRVQSIIRCVAQRLK
eukprot:gene3235-4079_t